MGMKLSAFAFTLCATACGSKTPTEPPTSVAIDSLCTAQLREEQRVVVEGYLGLGTLVSCGNDCHIDLWPSPEGAKEPYVSAYIPVGSGKNQMKRMTREALTNRLLEVTSNEGAVLGVGAKVRVTGVRLAPGPSGCAINKVERVEKLD